VTYVQVPVPEEHVPAVLEFVLSRVRTTTPVEATAEAPNNQSDDHEGDAELVSLVTAVSEAARTLLQRVARKPETWMSFETLTQVARVPNPGAALQSLQIQCSKLGIDSPISKRRDPWHGRKSYWMSAPTAARILRIIEGDH
jgi:hypothetical protein